MKRLLAEITSDQDEGLKFHIRRGSSTKTRLPRFYIRRATLMMKKRKGKVL